MAYRYAQAHRPYLEEGVLRGWRRLGGWRTVSGGNSAGKFLRQAAPQRKPHLTARVLSLFRARKRKSLTAEFAEKSRKACREKGASRYSLRSSRPFAAPFAVKGPISKRKRRRATV